MASAIFRLAPAYLAFTLVLGMNIALWSYSHDLRPVWGNVPPVPDKAAAERMTLGDPQMAYRMIGLMLQNLGATGGRDFALKDYDYKTLGGWFYLEDELDPLSDYIPALAAYYYGATPEASDLMPVIDYLEAIGQRPQAHKWRWLAQAVYLARFRQGDLNRALALAQILAALPRTDMPLWARQMPAFIINARGDKEAAYALMMGVLGEGGKDLSPAEILFIRDYICGRILTPAQAEKDELCQPGR
ncbi:MAG: hypothetical protein HYU57_09205 [Micavibrio aeruginosavorus]|nr:hypothetical protein [Micavibrio aeruginosavorus]